MSDEGRGKGLLEHFNEITKEYHQHCEWTDDKYSAVEQIRNLITQQKSMSINPHVAIGMEAGKQVVFGLDENRGMGKDAGIQQKPEVDKTFVENWRKRFFLLLIKFEEKGMLDDDDRTVLKSLEVNLDNFISEMLTEAKVEIKK